MAPLVEALTGNEHLATLSIRTLEYWVDSLNPEFLEPAMLPVIPQLMRALWSHLRPLRRDAPQAFATKVWHINPSADIVPRSLCPMEARASAEVWSFLLRVITLQ